MSRKAIHNAYPDRVPDQHTCPMRFQARRNLFYQRPSINVYRIFLYILLILVFIWFTLQLEKGTIKRPFDPTPTPTRAAQSFALEGEAHFEAGELDAAITAYQEALAVNPNDAAIWAELARIQVYTSSLLSTDTQRTTRLGEAMQSIENAIEIAPDNSMVRAIYAFVLNWNATPLLFSLDSEEQQEGQRMLSQAEQEAVRALQLDNQNTLALAYYAEILVDQQKWAQAEQIILQAIERDPSIMDVHRVHAYVLESTARYAAAIEAYQKAAAIDPNLTFLYIRIGANYRRLAFDATIPDTRNHLYDQALSYFDRAARLNIQLEIKDPIPYIAIARTYSQQGEFFIAARNVQRALDLDPSNSDTMGQLGVIFFKARNYEGSIPVLRCAIRGCTAEESCLARYGRECNPNFGETGVALEGLKLSPRTVVYYYTFGSVLAALSRPQENYCPEALEVLAEVRAAFPGDRDIIAIVQAGEQICATLPPP